MKRGGFRKDYEVSGHFEIVHAGKFSHACVRTVNPLMASKVSSISFLQRTILPVHVM